MYQDRFSNDTELAIVIAGWLQLLDSPTAIADLDRSVPLLLGGLGSSGMIPQTDAINATYYAAFEDQCVVLSQGTRTLTQGTRLASGYNNNGGTARFGNSNDYLEFLCANLAGSVGLSQALARPNVWLFGHSLGGALMVTLAAYLRINYPPSRIRVMTFGGPRTGCRQLVDNVHNIDITRWMSDDDPVPLVPPTPQQAPALLLTIPIQSGVIWTRQRHVQGGVSIASNGDTDNAELPPVAVMSPTTSLGSWLYSLFGTEANTHSLSTYVSRLRLHFAQVQGVVGTHGRSTPPEPSHALTSQEVTKANQKTASVLFGSGESQNAQIPVIPRQLAFRAAKVNGVWYTTLGSLIVSIGPTKKKARALANSGNEFFRRLQRQGGVSPTTLEDGIDEYLTLAATPGSGIQPTLRIGV